MILARAWTWWVVLLLMEAETGCSSGCFSCASDGGGRDIDLSGRWDVQYQGLFYLVGALSGAIEGISVLSRVGVIIDYIVAKVDIF